MTNYRKPHRIKKKKPFFKNGFFWFAILILVFGGTIIYFIFFSSYFQVKDIKVYGNERLSADDLRSQVNRRTENNFLFFPTKSIFLIDIPKIGKEILTNYPLISQINLKTELPNTIILQIKERKPVAIFCTSFKGENEECFFIDEQGIVFERTEAKPEFVLIKKNIDRNINLGEELLTREKVMAILEIEQRLKNELKIFPKEIICVSDERFDIPTLEGFEIYFNFQEDINWQLTKLRAVLEKEIPSEKYKDLEYIDVRFGNFAPYKYR